MSLPPEKFRELLFQILYKHHFLTNEEDSLGFYMSQLKTTKKNVVEALSYVSKVLEKKDLLDEKIEQFTIGYELERIHSVEKTILNLGAYQILFDDNVPAKVAISEALRLAKKFSTKEATSFINAILDQIYKNNS